MQIQRDWKFEYPLLTFHCSCFTSESLRYDSGHLLLRCFLLLIFDQYLNCCFQSGEAGEESSDSDGEQDETSHKLIRKVSTSGQIRTKVGNKRVCVCSWRWGCDLAAVLSIHPSVPSGRRALGTLCLTLEKSGNWELLLKIDL